MMEIVMEIIMKMFPSNDDTISIWISGIGIFFW